ncbi:MAG: glutaredoxin 3, partial [Sphingomonadales bacterium]|nr:glutaredoxin 3 [Sphingomonadales bacterium]
MARVEIYTKFGCPYCARAKRLLEDKGVDYEEYELNSSPGKREAMVQRAPAAFTGAEGRRRRKARLAQPSGRALTSARSRSRRRGRLSAGASKRG